MAKNLSLDVRAQNYWAGRKANGVEGLALLDKCIERCAKHRDWDALSRFLVQSRAHGQGARVGSIIRAAFGNRIAFKGNVKHPTGGTFVLMWEGAFDLRASNTYGAIREAVAKGLSWDSKEVGKLLPKVEKKEKVVSDEAKAKEAKAIAKKLGDLRKAGFDIGELVREAQALLAKEAAVAAAPVGKVVNGEPNF